MRTDVKKQRRVSRHRRVRARLSGTAKRPRLSVFRSNRHIHLQVIDDGKGVTLAAASTRDVKGKGTLADKIKETAKILADKAQKSGIKEMVFDRGGFIYHGNIKAVAEAVREAGIKI